MSAGDQTPSNLPPGIWQDLLRHAYPPYAAWFRRRFGIEHEQALDLFHQTVSMKSVGNLTDFVRHHMLEPFDVGTRIEALIRHFDDLGLPALSDRDRRDRQVHRPPAEDQGRPAGCGPQPAPGERQGPGRDDQEADQGQPDHGGEVCGAQKSDTSAAD